MTPSESAITDPPPTTPREGARVMRGRLGAIESAFAEMQARLVEKDVEHGEYLNDKFYQLSAERKFNIYVDYGDIVELSNKSGIEAFKEAIDDYYMKYVCGKDSKGRQQDKPKESKDLYFFLIIMPDSIKQEHLYTALKNKINTDSPVISQFVSSKTIQKYNDRIYINILR